MDFLTDEQMQALEDQGQATVTPSESSGDFLSDEDMQKLEDQGMATAQAGPEVSQAESGIRGAAQGLSLGYADELAGAAEAAGDVLGGTPISKLADAYRQHRDESRQLYENAKEANPKTYMAGEIGGGVAGAFVPGLNLAKGAKGAAVLGGAMGLGLSEADLLAGEFGDAAKDAAKGAALGGAVGLVGEKLSSLIAKGGAGVQKMANQAQYGGLGARAKDVAKDLGLGKTAFPGKAAKEGLVEVGKAPPNLERGMADTLREHNILSLKGGSKAALDNIDNVMESNRQAYNTFFSQVDEAVAAKAAQNPKNAVAVPGSQMADNTSSGSLVDQFKALTGQFSGHLKKQFGTSEAQKRFTTDASEYTKLLSDADYDLRKLNELKQLLGKQLSETNWFTASADLAPQKDFLKKAYGLVKGRMEELADNVSPGAGETMRKLNQEYGNLATARGIAFREHSKDMIAPMVGPLELMGGATAIATQNPAFLAAAAGKKGLEMYSGHSIDRLSKIATAKALDGLAKSLQTVSDPAAQGIAAEVFKISQNPSLIARVSALSALMSNPTTKDIIAPHIPNVPKDIQVKTPAITTDGSKVKAGYDTQYSEQSLEALQNRITPEMGNSGEQLKNVLASIKGRDTRSRNAMMFALEQNPAYRPLLKKLRGSEDGPATDGTGTE